MNSAVDDSKFSVTQSMQFPTVYVQMAKVNNSNIEISELRLKLNETQLRAEVKRRFFDLLILERRIGLLKTADSIYAQFRQKTERRFSLGDADVLENSTALHHHQQARNQLNQAVAEQDVKMIEFQILLGTDEPIALQNDGLIYPIKIGDTSTAASPSVRLSNAMRNQRQLQHKYEKSKLLPDLTFGYNNLSLIGPQLVGTEERYFNRNDRFKYWSFGLSIPIFNWAQRARIQAAKVQVEIQDIAAEAEGRKVKAELANKVRLFSEASRQVETYNQSLTLTSDAILNAASKRLDSGEISYLEWVILVNQAIEIKSQYLNTIQRRNDIALSIEELQGI
jgi:cobalt-zinc-cadmium resistance protein CzcA